MSRQTKGRQRVTPIKSQKASTTPAPPTRLVIAPAAANAIAGAQAQVNAAQAQLNALVTGVVTAAGHSDAHLVGADFSDPAAPVLLLHLPESAAP